MVFGNGVKNIQAAAYNGARTVYAILNVKQFQINNMFVTCFHKFRIQESTRDSSRMSNEKLAILNQIIL